MKYFLNTDKTGRNYPPICFYDEAFTEEELVKIENYCETLTKKEAGIQSNTSTDSKFDNNIRKTNIAWVHRDDETAPWIDRFHQVALMMNDGFYNMNFTSYEDFQYTCYDSEQSKYDFHIDTHMGTYASIQRKMTAILILSKPEEYVGGKFQIKTDNFERTIEQPRGRMIFFPAFILHRVTPIESGVRKSLVNWLSGPHFK